MKQLLCKSFLIILLSLLVCQLSQVSCQGNLSDSLVKERLLFVQKSLKTDAQKTRYWWNGWLYGYSAASVGQGAVYFISNDKSTKQDMALGAITTILGAANQFITPLKPSSDIDSLFLFPENNTAEQLYELEFAEKLLKERALREQETRNWQAHAICGAVNIGSGLVTWLGFKRTVWDGLENFALNTAITEAQIWSQPIRAKRDYEKYCKGNLSSNSPNTKLSELYWYVSVYPGGAGIRIVF
jgi:hypothetical protein